MSNKKCIVMVVAILLFFGAALSGCAEDNETGDGDGNGGGELTGTTTYSGTWSGTSEDMGDISGTWEYEVDFDEGTVDGSFTGDASGDITGSVSDGELEAEGDAAFGTVEWSGDFDSDGSEVSGEWELIDYEGSGTWSGEEGTDDDGSNDDGSDDTGNVIEDASSLSYKWTWEDDEGGGTWTYKSKDMNTEDLKLRVEFTEDEDKSGSIIINQELGKGWIKDDGQWRELSPQEYSVMKEQFVPSFQDVVEQLINSWHGGSIEVTDPDTGSTVTMHDIEVDPDLSDSIFEH